MQSPNRQSVLMVALVVLISAAFIGVATAHVTGGTDAHDECEIMYGEEKCPTMDGDMMGMMHTSDDCPMDGGDGMMGMHGDSARDHDDCPMR